MVPLVVFSSNGTHRGQQQTVFEGCFLAPLQWQRWRGLNADSLVHALFVGSYRGTWAVSAHADTTSWNVRLWATSLRHTLRRGRGCKATMNSSQLGSGVGRLAELLMVLADKVLDILCGMVRLATGVRITVIVMVVECAVRPQRDALPSIG